MKRVLVLGVLLLACRLAQAQTPISALPAATTSTTGLEPFPVVQSAATKKMTLSQIAAWLVTQNFTWTGVNGFQAITGTTASFSGAVTAGGGIIGSGSSLLLQAPSTTTFNQISAQNSSVHGMEVSVAGNGSASATAACLTSNTDVGAEGACSMPANKQGVGANGTLFLHTGNATIQTDATTVPWPKVAFGGWDGVGGCIQDTQIAISGFQPGNFTCTRLGTGQYQIVPLTGQFTQPPACTVSAGSGGGGGANANSVQSLEVGSSPPFIISLIMFNVSIAFQDNHFILTCMGL
jgi:hypothetical protein